MRSRIKMRWVLGAVVAVIVIAAIVGVPYARRHAATEYRVIPSPDGRYKVVIYSLPQLFPVGPGQGSDANGFVQLQDQEGHVLQEKDVEMVQNIDQIYWGPGKVDIKLFAEWTLP
jgi:hypothetical protein